MKLLTVELKNGGTAIAVPCTYDPETPAVEICTTCAVGLCSSCGYIAEDKVNHYCNDCWKIYQEEELGICSNCGEELAGEYEERHPDGIGLTEIVGYKPCQICREENL